MVTFEGSVALRRGRVMYCFLMLPDHAPDPKSLQTSTLSRRYYCSVRSLVSGVFTQFTQSGRDNGRAWDYRGPFHTS